MKRVFSYLEIIYKNLTRNAWDNCIVISGDEGRGKSTLALHIAEWWFNKLKGECNEEDAKHICLTRKEWAADLKDMVKYELTVYDEAGDINSRRSMSGFNVDVMEAYQIIRADNLFTILVLPSVFDLDTFFRKRRVRHLFHVYRRGRVAFWSRSRLVKNLEINEARTIKNLFTVTPTFYDTYPKYKGCLLEPYEKKKNEKMKGVRQAFYDKMSSDKKVSIYTKRDELVTALASKLGSKEAAKISGLSQRSIQAIVKKTQAVQCDEVYSNSSKVVV